MVDRQEAVEEILRNLHEMTAETVNTSMRLPRSLRDAATIAVNVLDVAESTTALTVQALVDALETSALEVSLAGHYDRHPETRPSLAEVALALAEQTGSPLAEQPDLIDRAAQQVVVRHPDATAHDVLLWSEALQSVA